MCTGAGSAKKRKKRKEDAGKQRKSTEDDENRKKNEERGRKEQPRSQRGTTRTRTKLAIGGLLVMGWMIRGAGAEGGGVCPQLTVMRRDEEGLLIATSIVMKTGKMIMEAAEKELRVG